MMTPKWEVRISDLAISFSRRPISDFADRPTPFGTMTSSGSELNPVLPEPSPASGRVVEDARHSSEDFWAPSQGSDVFTADAANKIISTSERSANSQPARLMRVFDAFLVTNAVVLQDCRDISIDCDETFRGLLHLCHAAANFNSCT